MNRKAAGILLSIASVALLAGILCRPSAESMSPKRHAVQTPVASPIASTDSRRVEGTDPGFQTTSGASSKARIAQGSEATAPELQAAVPGDDREPAPPGSRVPDATLVQLHGSQPLTTDHPEVAAAIKIQERNTPWLMAIPGVVGTAVGVNDDGAIVLTVYTKVDQVELPKAIEGLPIVVWKSGEIVALRQGQAVAEARPQAGTAFDTTARVRPALIGLSTGHPSITAGTIGCRVVGTKGVCLLSNNHVFAAENTAAIGSNVLQPGNFDGGEDPADKIGQLADYEPISFTPGTSNTIDAAIAVLTDSFENKTPPGGYGTPSSETRPAALGMKVMKYGRTTGQTSGKVTGLNASLNVDYGPAGVARFINQVVISGGSFSRGGDSGSLIVIQSGADARRAVGLLFAGGGSSTIANPIGLVLSRFGATIQ